jgi:hypothetical protein
MVERHAVNMRDNCSSQFLGVWLHSINRQNPRLLRAGVSVRIWLEPLGNINYVLHGSVKDVVDHIKGGIVPTVIVKYSHHTINHLPNHIQLVELMKNIRNGINGGYTNSH